MYLYRQTSLILKPWKSFYSVSIQYEKQQINQFYGKKTPFNTNLETIPIHYNKGFIVVLYLYVEELFKYFYLIIFSKSFQIKPS